MAANNGLDFNDSNSPDTGGEGSLPFNITVFRFDPRNLLLYIALKWRWLLIFFFASVLTVWVVEKWASIHSDTAWTAEATVLHQSRSNKVPSYYQQMDTSTVMQFFGSTAVQNTVSERLRNSTQYSFTPSLLRNVIVSREKNRSSTISIKASANTPQTAAALANEVANEGIAEYVKQQDSKIKTILRERSQQLTNVTKELAALQYDKKKLYSSNAVLSPDLELTRKNEELSLFVSKKEELQIKLDSLGISIASVQRLLDETPEMEEGEKRIDNTRSLGLTGKKAELENLLKRYTTENPKVRVLLDEIAILEKNQEAGSNSVADVVILRKNPVYSTLKSQITALEIERESTLSAISQYETNQVTKENEMQDLLGRSIAYNDLLQREEQLKLGSQKIMDSISDLEFMMSSSVPDVSIFSKAVVPKVSNIGNAKYKILGIGIFLTFVFIVGIAISRLLKLTLVAASEYETALGIGVIGELPLASESSKEIRESAFQKILQNIKPFVEGHKRMGMIKFSPSDFFENEFREILDTALVSGLKTFRLKCLPASKTSLAVAQTPRDDDELAQSLVSVVKIADEGYFSFQNSLCMDSAEMDLLRFDTEALSASYDIVILEIECDEDSELLSTQLGQLSDCVVFAVPFDSIKKTTLLDHIKQINEKTDVKMAGLLTDVTKPYYGG